MISQQSITNVVAFHAAFTYNNGEDLQENLSTYNLQLQQVEASLTNDPGNEDLLKLKKDLQEVINLTQELLSQNTKTKKVPEHSTAPTDSSTQATHGNVVRDVTAAGTQGTVSQSVPAHEWTVGDECLALWSSDGGYYPAVVEEILENGACTVTFQSYGNTDLTQIHLLRKIEEKSDGNGGAGGKPKSKKDIIAQQREQKRKKQQKKAQRQKQMEEEREQEKNKWINFTTKTLSKTSKGKVKKSIFATTDTVQGRVGVGTCGTSGRPMTNYHQQEKWKKS
ncbi:survival of motor neuron-related-splicing factor 30-like [Liolophura sinensis]|uniref:survival of motor neuron-related-splicing factor 30-like n=1 Tax=Liolophura sinensis TaxID=3198878 RepID=UPI0031589CD7